jgi:ribosome-interacting GTPase 1
LDVILAELVRSQVSPEKLESNAGIFKTRSGGVQLVAAGRLLGCTREEIASLLKNYGISNAIVRTTGDVTLNNIEDVILETNLVYKPTFVIANKADLPHALERHKQLLDIVGSKMHIFAVSSHTGIGFSSIGRELFEALDLVRVYTREPNATRPSPDPFIIRKGSTVGANPQDTQRTLQ